MTWLTPRVLLRVENLVIAIGLLVLYVRIGGPWGLVLGLILVPDLSMLGYAAGPVVGAAIYNLIHTYSVPLGLAGYGLLGDHSRTVLVALVWLIHISVDRALGFGLKYPTAFQDTHLKRV